MSRDIRGLPEVSGNVAAGLQELSGTNDELQPRIEDLYARSLNGLVSEGLDIDTLGVDEEYLGGAATSFQSGGREYEARPFARRVADDALGSREIHTGLKFHDKTQPKAGFRELTIYPSGMLLFDGESDKQVVEENLGFAEAMYDRLASRRGERIRGTLAGMRDRTKEIALRTGRVVKPALALSLVGLSVAAAERLGVHHVFSSGSARYDLHGYKLPGGTVLGIGEDGSPAFSRDLLQEPSLSPDELPRVNKNIKNEANRDRYTHDNVVDTSDGLREIFITSPNEGENCASKKVNELTRDSKLRIWTDSLDPEGNPRNEQLRVRLNSDGELAACWFDGVEANKSDDPRIVFDVTK